MSYVESLFSLKGKVAVVTGGAGALAGAATEGLGRAGAYVVLADIRPLEPSIDKLRELGVDALGMHMDVMDKQSIVSAAAEIKENCGKIDILINAAGGNSPEASTSTECSFFDLSQEALHQVVSLNLFGGAILPCQVFAPMMVDSNSGSIVNFSSPCAGRPLTRVVGYSAAKAAVSNFTQWLAVHIAQEYSPRIRVNAIAPGFVLTDQNRYLLQDDNGGLTQRGGSVIEHTPLVRFGQPDDLISTILWLCSPASSFVTGAVIPVDGGLTAYSGI